MREYYYLSDLDDSRYNLSLADAVHLGARGKLKLYAFINDFILMECRKTGKKIEQGHFYLRISESDTSAIEKEMVKSFEAYMEDSVAAVLGSSSYRSKLPSKQILHFGTLDKRCNGAQPAPSSLTKDTNLPTEVKVWGRPHLPSIGGPIGTVYEGVTLDEAPLLCWTDDLERLVEQNQIQRKDAQQTSGIDTSSADTLPVDFQALIESIGAGELPNLDLLITAWRKFWKGRRFGDGRPYPLNREVAAWILSQMENSSGTIADCLASTILSGPRQL